VFEPVWSRHNVTDRVIDRRPDGRKDDLLVSVGIVNRALRSIAHCVIASRGKNWTLWYCLQRLMTQPKFPISRAADSTATFRLIHRLKSLNTPTMYHLATGILKGQLALIWTVIGLGSGIEVTNAEYWLIFCLHVVVGAFDCILLRISILLTYIGSRI